MEKIIKILLILWLMPLVFSCSSSDDDEPTIPDTEDESSYGKMPRQLNKITLTTKTAYVDETTDVFYNPVYKNGQVVSCYNNFIGWEGKFSYTYDVDNNHINIHINSYDEDIDYLDLNYTLKDKLISSCSWVEVYSNGTPDQKVESVFKYNYKDQLIYGKSVTTGGYVKKGTEFIDEVEYTWEEDNITQIREWYNNDTSTEMIRYFNYSKSLYSNFKNTFPPIYDYLTIVMLEIDPILQAEGFFGQSIPKQPIISSYTSLSKEPTTKFTFTVDKKSYLTKAYESWLSNSSWYREYVYDWQ